MSYKTYFFLIGRSLAGARDDSPSCVVVGRSGDSQRELLKGREYQCESPLLPPSTKNACHSESRGSGMRNLFELAGDSLLVSSTYLNRGAVPKL